jgi:hypothetical protein
MARCAARCWPEPVLCGAGAVLGIVLAQPLVAMVSRYAPASRSARST